MRHRALPLAALIAGIAALVGGVALAVTAHSREGSRVDLALQRSVDTSSQALGKQFESAGVVALFLATNSGFDEWYSAPRTTEGRKRLDATLLRIGKVGQGFAGVVAFVDQSGLELARVVDGTPSPQWQLSAGEADEPYFAPALAAPAGTVVFTRPYRSPRTGRWVVSAATPVTAETRRGMLHAEVAVDAFGTALRPADDDVTLTVVDPASKRVIFDAGLAAHGPRDLREADPYIVRAVGTASLPRAEKVDGVRTLSEHLPPVTGNANAWVVVAGAPPVGAFGLGSFEPPAIALIALGLLLVVLMLVIVRRTRHDAAAQMADAEQRRRVAERQSRTDLLTGLLNRRGFGERLHAELARASREGNAPGLLLADVDRFKTVNDTYGHPVGDQVLVEVARRLARAGRQYDAVGRWGGEEFVVLVASAGDDASLRASAERLRAAIADEPVRTAEGLELHVSVSIGGAVGGTGLWTVEALADAADRAMYAAKRRGRDCVRLHSDLDAEDDQPHEPESIRVAQALALAASVREGMPELHCQQVADLSAAIAESLGLTEHGILTCRLGGWLHDVGKVAIPDEVLSKRGPLDDDEWALMRRHATIGETIVARVPALSDAARAVRHHHERWDGRGYPDGLAAEQIPLEARIVAAADAYSAIASDRPYRAERGRDEAIAELRASAGTHLDPQVVDALLAALQQADEAFAASLDAQH